MAAKASALQAARAAARIAAASASRAARSAAASASRAARSAARAESSVCVSGAALRSGPSRRDETPRLWHLASLLYDTVPGKDVTDKDLESDEATWALYERWCKAYNKERDHAAMASRFNTFKSFAEYVHRTNQAHLSHDYDRLLSDLEDEPLTEEEERRFLDEFVKNRGKLGAYADGMNESLYQKYKERFGLARCGKLHPTPPTHLSPWELTKRCVPCTCRSS